MDQVIIAIAIVCAAFLVILFRITSSTSKAVDLEFSCSKLKGLSFKIKTKEKSTQSDMSAKIN